MITRDNEVELARQMDALSCLIRSAPGFAQALRWWTGSELRREPRVQNSTQCLDERDAVLLALAPGEKVTRRDGFLVVHHSWPLFRAASVVALVHEPGLALDHEQRAAYRQGVIPLSQILRGCHRSTHYACRLAGDPDDGAQPAIRSRSTLLRAGRPVALIWETVYWRLITHRLPAGSSRYTEAAPSMVVGW